MESKAQFGGGAMPDEVISSYSLRIKQISESRKRKSECAKGLFMGLLKLDKPILGILKQGEVHFDTLTIFEKDIQYIVKAINKIHKEIYC